MYVIRPHVSWYMVTRLGTSHRLIIWTWMHSSYWPRKHPIYLVVIIFFKTWRRVSFTYVLNPKMTSQVAFKISNNHLYNPNLLSKHLRRNKAHIHTTHSYSVQNKSKKSGYHTSSVTAASRFPIIIKPHIINLKSK